MKTDAISIGFLLCDKSHNYITFFMFKSTQVHFKVPYYIIRELKKN